MTNFGYGYTASWLNPRSVAAGTGGVIGPHYASSKSAMHGLVHWIATRYAKEGIVRLN